MASSVRIDMKDEDRTAFCEPVGDRTQCEVYDDEGGFIPNHDTARDNYTQVDGFEVGKIRASDKEVIMDRGKDKLTIDDRRE